MNYKQFNNNNFNVKADEVGPHTSLVQDLVNESSLDFNYDGNMFTLGNSMAAVSVINHGTQCVYIISDKDMQDYNAGKTVKLVAIPITDGEY